MLIEDDFFEMFHRKVFCPGETQLLKTARVHPSPMGERVDQLQDLVEDLQERLKGLERPRKRPKCNKAV